MAKSVRLEVITPSKRFYTGDIELVIVRTKTGDEGFMADHAWACKLLDVGEMWIQEAGSKTYRIAAVAEGFIDVKETITIFADAAEWAEDIDMERALSTKASMEDWLVHDQKHDPNEIAIAKIAIAKAITRMNVAEGGHRRKRP
jgi:F-type H+-transporting ATPase subunit epsilon